jgi:hypothetical protein
VILGAPDHTRDLRPQSAVAHSPLTTEHSGGLLLRQPVSFCLKAIPLSAEECEPEAAKDQHRKAGTDCQQRQH